MDKEAINLQLQEAKKFLQDVYKRQYLHILFVILLKIRPRKFEFTVILKSFHMSFSISSEKLFSIPITEYAPLKIKMAITGNGQASKEQVADMLQRMLHFAKEDMSTFMDVLL